MESLADVARYVMAVWRILRWLDSWLFEEDKEVR